MNRRMLLATLASFAMCGLGGCLNWQESYNHAARTECQREVNVDARRACLERVEDDARAKREEAREQEN
jgi:predicted small lipoprotein YifL